MNRLLNKWVVVAALTLALGACGGGGGDGGASGPPPTAGSGSVGGLWAADVVATNGNKVSSRVLVTEDGHYFGIAHDLSTNCVSLGYGTLVTQGTTVSGSGISELARYSEGSSSPGCSWSDGTTSAKATLSGSLVPRTSLTVTSAATTSSGMSLGTGTETWFYDRLYEFPSSLPGIAGYWVTSQGNAINVGTDGVLSVTNKETSCKLAGQVAVVNPSYNAYTVTGTVSGCNASATGLNGASVRALMMVDNTTQPQRLIVGQQTTSSNGVQIVAVTSATR